MPEALAAAGREIVNVDIVDGPGVDLVGDICDPSFRASIRGVAPSAVLAANVLEHVPDARRFSAALADLVPPGARLIVTVPHRFPYHPDPIDTRFRPSVDELQALFPQLTPAVASSVREWSLVPFTWHRLRAALSSPRAPRPKSGERPGSAGDDDGTTSSAFTKLAFLPWLLRPVAVSCLVLERPRP